MNETVKAMGFMERTLEEIRERGDSICDTLDLDFLETALTALREKVERDKGCPFCFVYKQGIYNYCPHCGRKLPEARNAK